MICMEVNEMRISEFMKKVIVPVGTAVFLGALFYPLCVEQGQCDYLKLWDSLWGTEDVPVDHSEGL